MRRSVVFLVILSLFSIPLFADATPDGAAIFKAKCAMCHGADGKGQTPMGKNLKLRDLASEDVQKQTDKELLTITSNGKGKMPPFKAKLSQAEITAVIGSVRDLAKKK